MRLSASRRARRTAADAAARTGISLDVLERRRSHLWIVAGLFILVASATVALAAGGDRAAAVLPLDGPVLGWAFLGVAVAFLLYAIGQERTLRRLTRALVEAETHTGAMRERIRDLTAVTRAGRLVSSELTVDDVLELLLESVLELAGGARGSVLLLDQDGAWLRVAAAAGDEPPAPGLVVAVDERLSEVVAGRSPTVLTGRDALEFVIDPDADAAASVLLTPLEIDGHVEGVVHLERDAGGPPFSDVELRSVSLFLEEAGPAVLNAREHHRRALRTAHLSEALERRSEFVATMVHDLRTPLTAIIGWMRVLEARAEQLSDGMREELHASITEQAKRLSGMVDEVLHVASAEAGSDLHRVLVDLAAVLKESVEACQAAAMAREGREREVSLELPDPPPDVWGDPEAIRRIVENLLMNALKYSPGGSPVEVWVDEDVAEVRIHVRDHGAGIAPKELPTIFDRFRRVSSKRDGSAGLGLYMVRSLAEAHGGRVWADSRVGLGSTFHVALPVRRESGERRGDGAASETDGHQPSASRRPTTPPT